MPASKLLSARKEKVESLAEMLYMNLCRDHLGMIKETGSLVPTYSMRHRVTRDRLQFASELTGRYFTQGLVKAALQHILTNYSDVRIRKDTPGFSLDQWLATTAEKLAQLLQRARRSTCSASSPAMDPDNMETQVWEQLDEEEDSCGFILRSS